MPKRDQILVGLDIGTIKICAIVAEITDAGALSVIGVGSSPSRGLRKGVVVDIESTVESIKKAVEEAELMAAVQINSVYTSIAGSHISAENCKGVVALKRAEVTREDIHRAIESARTVAVIPHERRILHVLPRECMVDGQEGVRQPLGLSGNRLEVNVQLPRIEIHGFSTVPPWTPDPEKVRPHFRRLRELKEQCEQILGAPLPQLSMGMSGDFEVAIEEDATLVRIGTALFGERPGR